MIRESGDIDVHIVTHAAAGGRFALPRVTGGALSVKRRVLGFAVALVVRAAAVVVPLQLRQRRSRSPPTSSPTSCSSSSSRSIGGIWPALFAAVLSGLTLDFLFVEPRLHRHDRRPAARGRARAVRRSSRSS